MFESLTNAIDNGLSIVGDLASGECPSKRQVAQMVSDGISIAAIAAATGQSVSFIEKLLED